LSIKNIAKIESDFESFVVCAQLSVGGGGI